MKSTVALAVLLVAAACVVSSTEAWGFGRRSSSSSSSRGQWSSKRNSTVSSNRTVIEVRRVDEEHPYFRSFSFNRNSSNSSNLLADLKRDLCQFFNQSRNITWLVKNDRLLITRDADVRMLKYGDQLEAWFVNSTAPSRSKTYYEFSKEARRTRWSSKDRSGWGKDGKDSKDSKDRKDRKNRRDRTDRRRPRPGSEEEVEGLEMEDAWF